MHRHRQKLLAAPIIALALLGGFLAGHYANNTSQALSNAMHVELYLYKNGQLIYYDPDDPAVKNFAALITEFIAGDVNPAAINTTDNVGKVAISNTDYPGYVFVSFSSDYSYSYTMSALPASYAAAQISSGGVTYDSASKSVTFSASINIAQNATIYGTGLYTQLYTPTGAFNFLLFYDPLSTPINVTAGDVVTVVYKIVVP